MKKTTCDLTDEVAELATMLSEFFQGEADEAAKAARAVSKTTYDLMRDGEELAMRLSELFQREADEG